METLSLNTCRLHGSPKSSTATVSPMHRGQHLDLMDDNNCIPFPKENHTNSPVSITPIIDHPSMSTPSRRQQQLSSATSTTATATASTIHQTNAADLDSSTSNRGAKSSTSQQQVVPKPETIRNRWHTCPELHKAMDGVTYIADHTKKEEESTKVIFLIVNQNYLNSLIVYDILIKNMMMIIVWK